MNENGCILIQSSLIFITKGPINKHLSLIEIVAVSWQKTDSYLEQWWNRLPTHAYFTQFQWVKGGVFAAVVIVSMNSKAD